MRAARLFAAVRTLPDVGPEGEERGHGRERAQGNRQRSTSPRDVRQRAGEDQSDREGTERERFGRRPAG